MPKVCEPCKFYSTENTPKTCPTCNGPLQFTLLPPQGQEPEPLPNASPGPGRASGRRDREGFLGGLGIDPRVAGVIACVVLSVVAFGIRQYQKRERLEQIQPGMHISQAAKLIDTGKGMNHSKRARFRDRFKPNDTSSGTFDYQDGGNHLVLHWKNGIVTGVENRGASGGTH